MKTTTGGTTPGDTVFQITGPDGHSETVKYSKFTGGSYELRNLPVGEYTVTENAESAKVEGYTLAVSGSGETKTVVKDGTTEFGITNSYSEVQKPKGSLKIVKTTTGGTTPGDTVFQITGPDGHSETVKYSKFTGGSYELRNLPVGEYTVTENAESAKVEGYTLAVSGSGETKTVVKDGTTEFGITNSYSEVQKPKGSLKIVKTTNGGITPNGTEFVITGPNNYSKTVTYSEFAGGPYVLSNLPVGEYTVTENADSAKVEGYTLAVSGDNCAAKDIENGVTAIFQIVNTYSPTPVIPDKPITPEKPTNSDKPTNPDKPIT
ncbi:MAG: hypothetical protein Q4F87_03570, partial [Eubacteriales bacterium]|nr:hypothetical protein [Eubacteriales bacterium]